MSIEFWFTICSTFLAILIEYFSKGKSIIAKIAISIAAVIAIASGILGLARINSQSKEDVTYKDIQEEEVYNNTFDNNKQSNMFTNFFETHEVNTNQIYFLLKRWNSYEDKDIKALSHDDENGIKLEAKSSILVQGEDAVADIHLTYNPKYNGDTIMSGKIVTMNETNSSNSMVKVSILVDDKLVWKSDKTITGQTVEPVEFKIDTEGCKNEVIIRFEYYMKEEGLSIAIFEN